MKTPIPIRVTLQKFHVTLESTDLHRVNSHKNGNLDFPEIHALFAMMILSRCRIAPRSFCNFMNKRKFSSTLIGKYYYIFI